MLTTHEAQGLLENGQVLDVDGDRIGKVGQVFLDDASGEPAWASVKTGLFGGADSFVPLRGATATGDDVTVPYAKDLVKDAPHVSSTDGHLDPHEEAELRTYYGLDDGSDRQQDHHDQHESVEAEPVAIEDADGSAPGVPAKREDRADTADLTGDADGSTR